MESLHSSKSSKSLTSPVRRRASSAPIAPPLTLLSLVALLALAACAPTASAHTAGGAKTARAAATPPAMATPGGLLVAWRTATMPAGAVAVRFAPSDASTAYLCADDGPAAPAISALPRLYKSIDSGATWTLLPSAPAIQPIADQIPDIAECALFVDAHDARDVFLQEGQFEPQGAGYDVARALWRSRDGGATWATLATVDKTNGFADLAVFGDRLIAQPIPSVYGAGQCGPNPGMPQPTSLIDASDDGGQTWRPIGQQIIAAGYLPNGMSAAGAWLFATAIQNPSAPCQPFGGETLWRSADAGATWSQVGLAEPSIQFVNFTAKASGSGCYGVAGVTEVNSAQPTLLFSSDSGATWASLPPAPGASATTPADQALLSAVVTPAGDILAAATADGMIARYQPSAAAPGWRSYALGVIGAWQLVQTPTGGQVWAFSFSYNSGQPASLASLTVA